MSSIEELSKDILATFRAWNRPEGSGNAWWADLLFARELAGRLEREGLCPTGREIEQQICELALCDLASRQPRLEEAMVRRFKNGEKPIEVAEHFHVTEQTIYYWQNKACADMSAFILAEEAAMRREQELAMTSGLPAKSYSKLFGADVLLDQIHDHVNREGPPWILTLTGYGGVGKSALADAATRTLICDRSFAYIVWMTYTPLTMNGRSLTPAALHEQVMLTLAAQPQIAAQNRPAVERNRAVQAALKSAPYLVIVDNVEEPEDLDYLLPELPRYTGPSRFLITSRARPGGTNNVPQLPIPTLSRPDSKALWRYEAQLLHLPGLAEVEDTLLDALYDRIGGNPLMLKVSVGLATQFTLADITADLDIQPTGVTDKTYRCVFEKAWTALSDRARLVMQSMALVGEDGTDINHLASISSLSEAETRTAIQELTGRSLLEARGNLDNKTYTIHRLTRTFLNAQLLDWRDVA